MFCVFDGERIPFASDLSANLVARWSSTLFNGDFYVRAASLFTGEYLANSDLDPIHKRDPYFLLDGRIGWRSDVFDVSVWEKT